MVLSCDDAVYRYRLLSDGRFVGCKNRRQCASSKTCEQKNRFLNEGSRTIGHAVMASCWNSVFQSTTLSDVGS